MLPTQLCSLCTDLQVEKTLQDLAASFPAPGPLCYSEPQEKSQRQPWHKNLSSLNDSSESCELCKQVLQGLRAARRHLVEDLRALGEWAEPPKDLDHDILTVSWYSDTQLQIVASPLNEFERKNMVSSLAECEGSLMLHGTLIVKCDGGGKGCGSWEGYSEIRAKFRISSKEGDIRENVGIDRTIVSDPLSQKVFEQLRFWLSLCSTDHLKCNGGYNGNIQLPSRVVKIGISESDLVYLQEQVESDGQSAPYAALSHCWGPKQGFTTTLETLERLKRGIVLKELPQTFQDAIRLTRELGIQYIWIDSLCIIQNDRKDWERESAKMAMIYRCAYIVIGASSAAADSEGFFHPRPALAVSLGQIDLKLLPPDLENINITADPVKGEPLGTRAWCLQERYLPRRMLLVGKQQMYWECAEMLASEDGMCMARDGDHLGQIKKTAAISLSISGISGRSPGDTTDINYFDWYETVKEYVGRNITSGSDRLPALGGLARALHGATSDEYLAGIWQKGLIEGLLWCRADGEKALTRPAAYRAPTWSWASIDGAVNFPVYNFYDRCKWKYRVANFELLATYVGSSLDPVGEDTFGAIKHGWIQIQGSLLPIQSVFDWAGTPYSAPSHVMDPLRSSACDKILKTKILLHGKSETFYLDGGFDTAKSEGKLFALFLARLPDCPSGHSVYMDIRFGLILEAFAPGKYKRVGIIDGVVKTHKPKVRSILSNKVHLENCLWKQHKEEGFPTNIVAPDPFGDLKQTMVTIV